MNRKTFRLDRYTEKCIERDIERGLFPNESEAIRSILRAYYVDQGFAPPVDIQERRGARPSLEGDGGRR